MTESTELDDIINKAKIEIERSDIVPARPLDPDEVTRQLLLIRKSVIALEAQCQMLKFWVDELKTHHHVTGELKGGIEDGTLPNERDADSTEE